jgi:hypothetical protein
LPSDRRRGMLGGMAKPFQFRLRTLFVIVAFIATFLGGMIFGRRLEVRRQRLETESMTPPGPIFTVEDDGYWEVPQKKAEENGPQAD